MRSLLLCLLVACSDDATPGPAADASTDKGTTTDAQTGDGGADGSDGGGFPACSATFANCTTFTDATAPAGNRTINFTDFDYSPKCLKIKAGQEVTFNAQGALDDFHAHPLKAACGPENLTNESSATKTAKFTLTKPGVYGYYCLQHGGEDGSLMAGAIQVIP